MNNAPKTANEEMILLGKINGFYGTQGWVKLFSHTQPRSQILDYQPLYIRPSRKHPKWQQDSKWQSINVLGKREQDPHILARLEGIESKEIAADYLGYDIAVTRAQLPKLPANEYYWSDLKGLNVFTLEKKLIGEVSHLIETGANDVLVIAPAAEGICEDKTREVMIPYTPGHHVQHISLEDNCITVDWDPNF